MVLSALGLEGCIGCSRAFYKSKVHVKGGAGVESFAGGFIGSGSFMEFSHITKGAGECRVFGIKWGNAFNYLACLLEGAW